MMALDLCNRFGNLEMGADELLENIVVTNTCEDDIPQIIEFVARSWGMSGNFEAFLQIVHSNMNLQKSVKVIDKRDGQIYGLLLLSNYPITEGSPIMMINPQLGRFLSQFSQVNGHSIIIDERLRNRGIDRKMLAMVQDWIKDFDFTWCAVEKDLKSHAYWKKKGFKKLFSIPDATFYILPNDNILEWSLTHFYDI